MFAAEYQVKQFVAVHRGWMVFRTGSDKHYLFCSMANLTFQVPVLKSRLRPEVASALANGWGHA